MAGDKRRATQSNTTKPKGALGFCARVSVAAIPMQHIPGRPTRLHAKPKAVANEFAEEPEEEVKKVEVTKKVSPSAQNLANSIAPVLQSNRKSQKSRMQALLESQLDQEFQNDEDNEKDADKAQKTTPRKEKNKASNTKGGVALKTQAPRKQAGGKRDQVAVYQGNSAKISNSKTVHSSSHKNHSVDVRSSKANGKTTKDNKSGGGLFGNTKKKLEVHTSEIRLTDKKNRKYLVDRTKMSLTSNQLGHGQVIAFWNAFMLFDHYETGVISASELSTTLNHLGLHTNEQELQAIIDAHDDNGNGALDFEEYLNLMTDPSIFQAMMQGNKPERKQPEPVQTSRPTTFHTPNKPDYRDCLMYEVMNEFFNCKSLGADQEREIVGFYAKTLKHIHTHKPHQQHAAHVVHHYADGARSLGLTEKEIKQEIDKIREKQKCEKNEKKRNSPYANPMRMIPRMDKSIEYKKKYNVMSRNNTKEGHLIWRGTPIVNYKVNLPRLEVNWSKTFENLKKIRHKAHDKNNQYRIGLSEVQKTNNKKLWSMLRYQHIPCERLKDVLTEVYGAYTTHVTMQPLDSKPRYVAYSIHDFKSVFPDLSDSDDEDGEGGFSLEQKRSTIHELSRQKLMMALKK